MMPKTISSLILVVLAGMSAFTEAADAPATSAATQSLDTISAALNQKIPTATYDGTPLMDVLAGLEQKSGTRFAVRWDVLAAAGVEKTSPVTARLRDVKLSKVLMA